MKARSVRRISIAILRSCKRISKTALLTLVFLFVVVGNVMPAFAQVGVFNEYVNLFDGTDPALKLTMQQAVTVNAPSGSVLTQTPGTPTTTPQSTTPAQALSYFKFNFQGSFKITNDQNKKWHWDHIKDFAPTATSKVFILRLCDVSASTGAVDENACLFSVVPYSTAPTNIDQKADGTPYCSNGVCTAPTETEPTTKIYHYRAQGVNGILSALDDQYSKFNVQFKISDLAPLSSTGTLGTNITKANKFKIGDPTKYQADLWYCGDNTNGQTLDSNTTTSSIHSFNNLCGDGKPYFKIAQSEQFQMPATDAAALSQTDTPVTPVNLVDSPSSTLPNCHILNGAGPGEGSFVGCIAWLVYYAIYVPISWFAGLFGMLFDFFLGYSLNDASYRADFAVRGWQLVRDISNIFFIIILVYTGLMTVFSNKSNMKQVLPNLILNALLINFSLFATRVIIDISNVTARVFYNSVEVCEGKCVKAADGSITNLKVGVGNYKPLSEKIVSSFNPQKIFSTQVLNVENATGSTKGVNGTVTFDDTSSDSEKTNPLNRNDYATYYIIVSLIAATILFAVAMMFWKTAFFFLGRVIGLYIAMIFSPFAFLSKGNMPIVSKIKEFSWDKWLSDTTMYALLAPIFVFFLYIIYSFIDSDFITGFTNVNSGSNFLETVIYIAIPMLIVYMMIKKGVKIAEDYAGEAGKLIQGYAEKATGFIGGAALGVATGGAAFAGTRLAGALKLSENKRADLMQQKAEGGISGRIASLRLGFNDKAQTGSFDFRKTSAFSKISDTASKQMGVKLNDKVSGLFNLGQDATKGGMKAVEKKEKDDAKKKIESLKTDLKDTDAKDFWNKKLSDIAHKEAESKRLEELKAEGKTAAEIAEMKKTNKFKDATYEDNVAKKVQALKTEHGTVETNKQLTQALRVEFAKTIAAGQTFGQQAGKPLAAVGTAGGVGTALGAGGFAAAGVTTGALGAFLYDQSRKNKSDVSVAKKFVDDAKDQREKGKFGSKEDRIENEKKIIDKKLEELNKQLNTVTSGFSAFFDQMIDRANAGEKAFEKYKGKTKGSYDSEKDKEETMEMYKRGLRAKTDVMENNIRDLDNRAGIARRAGKIKEAEDLEADRNDLYMQKEKHREDLNKLNDETKSRLESELAKKENELEKIKEKRENKEKESGK